MFSTAAAPFYISINSAKKFQFFSHFNTCYFLFFCFLVFFFCFAQQNMSGGNVCHFWSVTLRVNILFTDMVIPEGWDEMKPLSSDMGKRKNTKAVTPDVKVDESLDIKISTSIFMHHTPVFWVGQKVRSSFSMTSYRTFWLTQQENKTLRGLILYYAFKLWISGTQTVVINKSARNKSEEPFRTPETSIIEMIYPALARRKDRLMQISQISKAKRNHQRKLVSGTPQPQKSRWYRKSSKI